jgi:hypothetical protein
MTIELPVLRLGLAGFSAQQQERIGAAIADAADFTWELARFDQADACWIHGARTQLLPNDTIRVTPAVPTGRSMQMHLPEIDRPVAFALPLAHPGLAPALSFDLESPQAVAEVLRAFERALSPLTAQFALASHLIEHQSALGKGAYDVSLASRLLAVVDFQGDVGVVPGVEPTDFEDAEWRRRVPGFGIPDDFVRTTLSQLMWQYTTRTTRQLLPRHYRTGLLYFRRPPRLPQRVLGDAHLYLLRELAVEPVSFETLKVRSGMHEESLAHELASLYFVGAITSNARRAAPTQLVRRPGDVDPSGPSMLTSALDALATAEGGKVPDLTAPAPLWPR